MKKDEYEVYLKEQFKETDRLKSSFFSKEYGMTTLSFHKMLFWKGIIHFQEWNHKWVVNDKYRNMGYMPTSAQWTQKGAIFIYRRLKEDGVLPVSQRDPKERKYESF